MINFKKSSKHRKKKFDINSKKFKKKIFLTLFNRVSFKKLYNRAEIVFYSFEPINPNFKFTKFETSLRTNMYPTNFYRLSSRIVNQIAFSFEFENSKLNAIYFKNILSGNIVIYLDDSIKLIKRKKNKKIKIFSLSKIFKDYNLVSNENYTAIFETLLTDLKIPVYIDVYFIGYNLYTTLNYFKDIIKENAYVHNWLIKFEKNYQLVNKFQIPYNNIWSIDIIQFFNFSKENIAKVIPYKDIKKIYAFSNKRSKDIFVNKLHFKSHLIHNNLIAYIGDKIIRAITIITESFRKDPPWYFYNRATFTIIEKVANISNYSCYSYTKIFKNYDKIDGFTQIFDYEISKIYNVIVHFIPNWDTEFVKEKFINSQEFYKFFIKNSVAVGHVFIKYRFRESARSFIFSENNSEFFYRIEGEAKISIQKFIVIFDYFEIVEILNYKIYLASKNAHEVCAISENSFKLYHFFYKNTKKNKLLFQVGENLLGNLFIFYSIINDKNTDFHNDPDFLYVDSIIEAIRLEYLIYFYKIGHFKFLFIKDGFVSSKKLTKNESYGVGIYSRAVCTLIIIISQDQKENFFGLFNTQNLFELYLSDFEIEILYNNFQLFFDISKISKCSLVSIKQFCNDLINLIVIKNSIKFKFNTFIEFKIEFNHDLFVTVYLKKI